MLLSSLRRYWQIFCHYSIIFKAAASCCPCQWYFKCYFIVAHIEKKFAFCTAMYMLRLTILRLLIATVVLFFFSFCCSFNNTILIVALSKQWRRDSSRSAGDCRQTYEPCLLRWRCRGRDVDTLLVKHSTSGLCVWVAVSFFCVLHWINMFVFFCITKYIWWLFVSGKCYCSGECGMCTYCWCSKIDKFTVVSFPL